MSQFKVLAGDFKATTSYLNSGTLGLFDPKKNSPMPDYSIPLSSVRTVEVATEENVKRAAGTIGWAAAGGLLLGPIGLVGGALLGGRGKDVTFVVVFRDGRKLLARGNSSTYEKFLQAAFQSGTDRSASAASSRPTIDDVLGELRRLNAAHAAGNVNDDEYETRKAALVAKL